MRKSEVTFVVHHVFMKKDTHFPKWFSVERLIKTRGSLKEGFEKSF